MLEKAKLPIDTQQLAKTKNEAPLPKKKEQQNNFLVYILFHRQIQITYHKEYIRQKLHRTMQEHLLKTPSHHVRRHKGNYIVKAKNFQEYDEK